jgi:hypothetical protein
VLGQNWRQALQVKDLCDPAGGLFTRATRSYHERSDQLREDDELTGTAKNAIQRRRQIPEM